MCQPEWKMPQNPNVGFIFFHPYHSKFIRFLVVNEKLDLYILELKKKTLSMLELKERKMKKNKNVPHIKFHSEPLPHSIHVIHTIHTQLFTNNQIHRNELKVFR